MEHRHEWTQNGDNDFVCSVCDEQMTFQEAIPMLNAAECLTARDAENILDGWKGACLRHLEDYAERRKTA